MNLYLKKTLHYLAGNLFNKILLIVFLPIFTHYLIPEEYAVYTNYLIFIAFAGLFYLAGLTQSLFSFFYKENTNEYKYTLINSMVTTVVVIGILLSVLIVIFRSKFAVIIAGNIETADALFFIVFIIFFEAYHTITLSIVNILERSEIYAVLGASKNIVLLILLTFGAVSKQLGLEQILYYMLAAAVLSAVFSNIIIRKILREFQTKGARKYSFKLMKPIMKFGVIMIPGTLGFLILRVADRYMLTHLSSGALYDVGIYAVGYRVGMIMQFLVSAVSLVYFPYAMKIADSKIAAESFRNIYNYFILFGVLLGSTVILFSNEIFMIFIDPKYHSAVSIVFIGVISVFLHGVFNIINLGFYAKQKAGNIAVAVVSGALLNIVLNFLLIPKYGIYGAGIASVISYIYIVLFNFIAVQKVYKVGYSFAYLLISLLILGLVSYLNVVLSFSIAVTIFKISVVFISLIFVFVIGKRNNKFDFIIELLRKK
jgi:O-antigen/teichoic acid export membrane protein